MTDIAIHVENLGKQFQYGANLARYKTIRETISETAIAPIKRIRNILRGQAYGASQLEETFWALKDITLDVNKGEVMGIIGRNGAGKSTLLKILSRITEPTEGFAQVRGRIGSLLEVGTGFHPELTGRENVYLNGAILGMKSEEINRKFDEIVSFAEIEKFIDTPVKHYSSGMYVRLAFAVAAHLDTEILLVDEVLSVGDMEFQRKCLGKMSDITREGRTVLFVSHNMAAVQSLCRTGVLLDNGKLTGQGDINEVTAQYIKSLENGHTGLELQKPGSRIIAYYQTIELLHNGEEKTSIFQTGDHACIHMVIAINQPMRGIYIGASILDDMYRLIFAFHAKEAGLSIEDEIDHSLDVTIDIPQLLLLPGHYHIRTVLVSKDGAVLQEIPSAVSFDVLPKDLSGSGHPFEKEHGMVIIPFRIRAQYEDRIWTRSVLIDENQNTEQWASEHV